MNVYADLFESTVYCCDRIGLRHGLVYTVAMLTLSLGLSLNLLSLINLLWIFGVLENPYRSGGGVHLRHYVYAIVYLGFVANTILARVKFRADRQYIAPPPDTASPRIATSNISLIRVPGVAYVMGSAVLFLVTLTLDLLVRA